jgi:hypothetical protein
MTKKVRDFSLVAAALLLSSLAAAASPCDVKSLPEQIQSSLTGDYAGWKVVIPSTLEASDRGTWLENYSKECPGLIKGKFTGDHEGYVLNLVKKAPGQTLQQVIYFEPNESGYSPVVIFPSTAIKIVTVIRKFAPGKYKPANGGKSLLMKTDTIGMSQIDAWTEVYYWDGSSFRKMVTSD